MSPLPASTRRLVRNFQQPPLHYSIVVLQRRGSANPNGCVHAHRNGAVVSLHHTRREGCQLLCGRQKRRKQVTSPPSANRQTRRVTALYRNSPDVFGAVYAWTLRVRCRWSVDAALYHTSRGSTTTHTHNTRTRARTNERGSPRRQQTAHAPRANAHTTRVERERALAGVLCAAEVSWPRDAERRRRSVPTAQSAAVPTSVRQGVCVRLTRDALLPRLR